MRTLRITARAAGLAVTAAVIYPIWLLGSILLLPFRERRRRWRIFVIRNWARLLAKIVGVSIRVKGVPPHPPFFLVSNHLSYIDVIVYAATLGSLFVAKREIASWPIIGRIARTIGTIFIDRRSFHDIPRVIGMIDKNLCRGFGIVLFAEGTSTKGDKVLPFSPALLEPAARGNYPVFYATITYRTPADEMPAHIVVCWWDDKPFLSHALRLLSLRKFDAVLDFGTQALQAYDRKTLAKNLWVAVNDQFIPVVKPQSADHETGV
jgi:1-acyl-sn-glycerol-3-phosphate acyltransferase